METQTIAVPDLPSPNSGPSHDVYRGVILFLWAATFFGTTAAVVAAVLFSNSVLLDLALTLGIATGILIGVAVSQRARLKPRSSRPRASAEDLHMPRSESRLKRIFSLKALTASRRRLADLGAIRLIGIGTAAAGVIGIAVVLLVNFPATKPSALVAGSIAVICLGLAGLAATTVRYLEDLEPSVLPEAMGLCRGARLVAWVLLLAAISEGLSWAGQQPIVRFLHFLTLAVDAAVCYGLFTAKAPENEPIEIFPLDLGIFSLLGSRTNVLASVLDSGERQLGIDLRSTWALTVVRRSLEPLIIGLCLVGWLSTSMTVVGIEEQGLVERLGVPVQGEPYQPGLHLHWPWPVDQVFRMPVHRVQTLQVGHEGQEGKEPENVLWAVEHAPNEYTLLLGNGRDLITVDAAVQYRIMDARAWRYHSQNPAEALRAIAYRSVMRSTVNHTLSEALSQNVVTLTGAMRTMVQQDADALGLGVKIESFTVGGMHPPVPVAPDYEAVVSAELGKVTAVAQAQAVRNQTVPAAEASVLRNENAASADGVEALARAAGEAWSFRALESQYHAAPQEYFFRRRLETLEKTLSGHAFEVVDARIMRDGGELWLTQ